MSVAVFKGLRLGRVPALGAAILLYVIALGVATAYSYMQTRDSLLEQIDRELLLAANSVPLMLEGNFHDRALGPDAISQDEDLRNIRELSEFARRTKIACLFTAIEQAGETRLTARSASPTELASGVEVHYFAPYTEGRRQILDVLISDSPVTETYTDRWGAFRTVLVPAVSPQGQVYVAAAGLPVSELDGRLTRTLFQSLLTAGLLLIASLPVLLWNNLRLRLSEATLKRAVAARTRELEHLATLDPLTGHPNRRAFYDALGREVRRYDRYGSEFCLALLDLDRFKSVNDTYGHLTGDLVLRVFADAVAQEKRDLDTFARIGGEEFALLFPETSMDKAVCAAERVCARVRALTVEVPSGKKISVTVSIGLASSSEGGTDLESIVQIADERLYLAKTLGRDRVVADNGPEQAGFRVRDPDGQPDEAAPPT